MSTAKTLFGTFVIAFVLTVSALTVGAVVLDDGTPTTEVEHDHIDSSVIAEQTADGGEIEMESNEASNTVVIYTEAPPALGPGMAGPIPIEDQPTEHELSTGSLGGAERNAEPLATVLRENGHDVVYYNGPEAEAPLSQTLKEADAFVAVGSTALAPDEREAVNEFADAGGQTLIAADPGSSIDISQQGLFPTDGYLYNVAENDNNYLSLFIEPTEGAPLTDGVDRAVFRSVTTIGVSDGSTIMETDDTTRESTTREMGTYEVAAVNDNVAMIGDSSFLEPENAHRADNNVLVGNVADFLVTGQNPMYSPGEHTDSGVGDGFDDGSEDGFVPEDDVVSEDDR